jgi:hypothetical protein
LGICEGAIELVFNEKLAIAIFTMIGQPELGAAVGPALKAIGEVVKGICSNTKYMDRNLF